MITGGREIVERGHTIMNGMLGSRDCLPDCFSIAGAALSYKEFWTDRLLTLERPPGRRAQCHRMLARPAV